MQEPVPPLEPTASAAPPRLPSAHVVRPAPSASGGSAWKWAAFVLTVVLLASLAANFALSAGKLAQAVGQGGHGRLGASHLEEFVLEDNGAGDKVAVLDIGGVISGEPERGGGPGMVDAIRDQLDRAAGDERVKAVVLRVDSPGGEVLASDEIYRALASFQTNHNIPVVASMGSIAITSPGRRSGPRPARP